MVDVKFGKLEAEEIQRGVRFGRIKTRQGDYVRILDWNVKGLFPLVGLADHGDYETVHQWTADGKADLRYNVHMPIDLVLEVEGGEA